MQMNSSYVVSDSYGLILTKVGKLLVEKGNYKIKNFDLCNYKKTIKTYGMILCSHYKKEVSDDNLQKILSLYNLSATAQPKAKEAADTYIHFFVIYVSIFYLQKGQENGY